MKRQIKSSECLNGQTVNFSVDRWSNVRNKAMLCAVVTTKNVENYLVDTNDTQSNSSIKSGKEFIVLSFKKTPLFTFF